MGGFFNRNLIFSLCNESFKLCSWCCFHHHFVGSSQPSFGAEWKEPTSPICRRENEGPRLKAENARIIPGLTFNAPPHCGTPASNPRSKRGGTWRDCLEEEVALRSPFIFPKRGRRDPLGSLVSPRGPQLISSRAPSFTSSLLFWDMPSVGHGTQGPGSGTHWVLSFCPFSPPAPSFSFAPLTLSLSLLFVPHLSTLLSSPSPSP